MLRQSALLSITIMLVIPGIGAVGPCFLLPRVADPSLTFHVRQERASEPSNGDTTTWKLDAVGTWHRPTVGSFSGYAAKLFNGSVVSETSELCAMDPAYNLTQALARWPYKKMQILNYDEFDHRAMMINPFIKERYDHLTKLINETITFPDVDFGFSYTMRVRSFDKANGDFVFAMQKSDSLPTYSPDCFEETQSVEFCRDKAVQTTGKPIDLLVDNIIRQSDGRFTIRTSWVRPLQANGVIKAYFVTVKLPDMGITDSNGFSRHLNATMEKEEWDPMRRYRYDVLDVPDSNEQMYILEVTPYFFPNADDSEAKGGQSARIPFNTTVAESPKLPETRIRRPPERMAMDSQIPEADPTHPPRGPPPDARAVVQGEEDILATVSATMPPFPGDESTPVAPRSDSLLMTALVAAGLAMIFVMLLLAIICMCFRRKKKDDELKKAVFIRTREEEISMYHHKGSLEKSETEYKECRPEFDVKELDRNLLKIEKELGSGQFGVVYKGFAFGVYTKDEYSPVAVKSLKRSACLSMKEDFLEEIKLIIEIGKHPNILAVLGCCTVDEPYYLITEFMEYGDLLHFLWKCREEHRPDDDPIYFLTETNKLQVARQITRGMEYLSNTRYYHGDLAARNILVGEGLVVKISDFGLADDIYQNGYKRLAPQRKRPVKWVSLETNVEGRCTIQSDVWSFGIVLYEIYTLGSMPYPGLDGREVIQRLQTGYRMDKPSGCPDDIYDIMAQCWREKPSERPTFTNLFNTFDKMLVAHCDYMPLEGAVYDHCLPSSGSGGIKTKLQEGGGSAAKAITHAAAATSTNQSDLNSECEQSDTARLCQEDEHE